MKKQIKNFIEEHMLLDREHLIYAIIQQFGITYPEALSEIASAEGKGLLR